MNVQKINKIPRPLVGPPDSRGTTPTQNTVTTSAQHYINTKIEFTEKFSIIVYIKLCLSHSGETSSIYRV
jgi:hypothetical protein